MRFLLTSLLIVAACDRPPPAPAPTPFGNTCGRICSSNLECSGDPLHRCAFCSFGSCRGSPPVAPPVDAGVDAPVDAAR